MNPSAAATDALAGLRGYHLPDAVAWWPPAPGWWLLAALLLVLAAALTLYLVRRRRRRAAARQALQELARLRSELVAGRRVDVFVRGLSRLLRRFALARFPRTQVAGLAGEDWLAFLDEHSGREAGEARFREGPGRLLAEAPYRPVADLPAEDLAVLVERWILHNRELRT